MFSSYIMLSHQNGVRLFSRGAVTIYDYECGLRYEGGIFQEVLGAGRYRIWPWSKRTILVLDTRRQTLDLTNQKLLTRDQVTIAVNVTLVYAIENPHLAVTSTSSYQTELHRALQLATREAVSSHTVDELLSNGAQINEALTAAVLPQAATFGLVIHSAAVRDIVLGARVRDMLMKEAEARRTAQATLIGAREEVAAMRALTNAARMASALPELLRLRELDSARGMAASGASIVLNLGANPATILPGNKPGDGGATQSSPQGTTPEEAAEL